eukprot:gene19694-26385_t
MARKRRELKHDTYVLVDGSYFIYHRYFAAKRYFQLSRKVPKDKVDEVIRMANPEFAQEYERLFVRELNMIAEPKGKGYTIPHENIIFAYDCLLENNFRVAQYPAYKGTRIAKRLDADVFGLTCDKIIPGLQRLTNMRVLRHCNVEADDIIGIVKTDLRSRCPDADIIIITNDNDYLPLWDSKTTIHNLQKGDNDIV